MFSAKGAFLFPPPNLFGLSLLRDWNDLLIILPHKKHFKIMHALSTNKQMTYAIN